MALDPKTKRNIEIISRICTVALNWGFMPTVLYLGFKKGADAGMPPLTFMNLLWH